MFKAWIEKFVTELIIGLFKDGKVGEAVRGVALILNEVAKRYPAVAAYKRTAVCYIVALAAKTPTKVDDALVALIAAELGIDPKICTP